MEIVSSSGRDVMETLEDICAVGYGRSTKEESSRCLTVNINGLPVRGNKALILTDAISLNKQLCIFHHVSRLHISVNVTHLAFRGYQFDARKTQC